MNLSIPKEVSSYFQPSNFIDYPLISIPQQFRDARGSILNLIDGEIGDVALITSKKDSIRANHYHENDWHFCYLISGKIQYTWADDLKGSPKVIVMEAGQMVFTPKMTPHKLDFLTDSIFISMSKKSRLEANYEKDTFRLDGFFNNF